MLDTNDLNSLCTWTSSRRFGRLGMILLSIRLRLAISGELMMVNGERNSIDALGRRVTGKAFMAALNQYINSLYSVKIGSFDLSNLLYFVPLFESSISPSHFHHPQ